MDKFNEAIMRFVRSTVEDPKGLSQESLMDLYKLVEHAQDREVKERLESMIRRIVIINDRYGLEVRREG